MCERFGVRFKQDQYTSQIQSVKTRESEGEESEDEEKE
jgi:hypothetical protein